MVGIVILFGMVFVGVALLAVSGMALLDGLQSSTTDDHAEQVLREVDSDLVNDRGTLHLAEHGEYTVSEEGNVTITASNRFGDVCTLVPDAAIGTLQHVNDDGETIGYQAGGIFRYADGGSVVVSDPDFEYYTKRSSGQPVRYLDFSVTSLYGEVGHGEHTATINRSSQEAVDCMDDIRFARYVEITVSGTPYHDGWAEYLADEFDVDSTDNDLVHDESNRTVVVEATVDRSRPFADYVDLYPTIYGGVYVDDTEVDPGTISVDGYDSRNGSYADEYPDRVTDDFFVANTDRLTVDGDVDGIPVVNGDLRVQPSGSIDPFAFHAGADVSPPGSTDYRNATLSDRFDEIGDADDEIARAVTLLGKDPGSTPVPTNADVDADDSELYYQSSSISLSNDDILTNDTTVNVATEGDLSLSDVELRGDGQVHVYVNGSSVDLSNVEVPDDRADALWVYATSGAEVTIDGEFGGVVYAPGADVELASGSEVFGAVVGGETDVGEGVEVHFDQSLRSAMPVPEEDRTVTFGGGMRNPLDVTFVLDRSGSMAGNDPAGLRVDATRNFIGMLDSGQGDRAGVFEFDDDGYETHPLSGDLESVNDSVQAVDGGFTDMSEGLGPALDEYMGAEADGRERVVVLLSDGENRPCFGRCEADEDTLDEAHRAADDLNATIHTIGLGDGIDEELLEDVAEITGGEYHPIANADELEDVFEGIAGNVTQGDDITFDTISQTANPTSNDHVFTFDHVKVDIEE